MPYLTIKITLVVNKAGGEKEAKDSSIAKTNKPPLLISIGEKH